MCSRNRSFYLIILYQAKYLLPNSYFHPRTYLTIYKNCFTEITPRNVAYNFLTMDLDKIVINYTEFVLIQYVTMLTNKLITSLNIDSFCSDGICYYSRCQHNNCEVEFCKYHLITGRKKCAFLQNTMENLFQTYGNKLFSNNEDNHVVNIMNKE